MHYSSVTRKRTLLRRIRNTIDDIFIYSYECTNKRIITFFSLLSRAHTRHCARPAIRPLFDLEMQLHRSQHPPYARELHLYGLRAITRRKEIR